MGTDSPVVPCIPSLSNRGLIRQGQAFRRFIAIQWHHSLTGAILLGMDKPTTPPQSQPSAQTQPRLTKGQMYEQAVRNGSPMRPRRCFLGLVKRVTLLSLLPRPYLAKVRETDHDGHAAVNLAAYAPSAKSQPRLTKEEAYAQAVRNGSPMRPNTFFRGHEKTAGTATSPPTQGV